MKKKILWLIAILLVLDRPTREWLVRQASAYSGILVFGLLLEIPLIVLGIALPWPKVTMLIFIVTIVVFLATMAPAAIINSGLNPNGGQIFIFRIRRVAALLALCGWLSVVHNPWLNFSVVIVSIFLSMIYGVFSPETKIDKLLTSFVTLMTIWFVWGLVMPDSHRAFGNLASSYFGVAVTSGDRQTIRNEGEAAITFATPTRMVIVVYQATIGQDGDDNDCITHLTEVSVQWSPGYIVKVLNHKQKPLTYQGQAFFKVQSKSNGSFVNGQTYWVAADEFFILTPGDLNKSPSVQIASMVPSAYRTGTTSAIPSTILPPGFHGFRLKKDQETPNFRVPSGGMDMKYGVGFRSPKYTYKVIYTYENGEVVEYQGDSTKVIPDGVNRVFKIRATDDDSVTVKVVAKPQ